MARSAGARLSATGCGAGAASATTMGVAAQRRDDVHEDWIAAGVQCPLCASLYIAAVLCCLAGAGTGIEIGGGGRAAALFSVGRYW